MAVELIRERSSLRARQKSVVDLSSRTGLTSPFWRQSMACSMSGWSRSEANPGLSPPTAVAVGVWVVLLGQRAAAGSSTSKTRDDDENWWLFSVSSVRGKSEAIRPTTRSRPGCWPPQGTRGRVLRSGSTGRPRVPRPLRDRPGKQGENRARGQEPPLQQLLRHLGGRRRRRATARDAYRRRWVGRAVRTRRSGLTASPVPPRSRRLL